jgi:arylsulfatase A-like enzyme
MRNLLLLTADSLRADHCGFLDSGADLTPALDEMATDGVVYDNAIAPGPRTPSSMPVAFTGEHLRPVRGERPDYWERVRRHIRRHMERNRTVAERLSDRGYSTVGVTVNPWTENTGFDAGFDRFVTLDSDVFQEYGSPGFRLVDGMLRDSRLGEYVKWYNKRDWFIRWVDLYEAIIEEIRRLDPPYFAWIFLLDTHQPYITPGRYRTESSAPGMYYSTLRELVSADEEIPAHVERGLRKAYRDSVRSVDEFVGTLRADTAGDDPIVVVHSDHGEAFGERGSYGHERALYRENLHVPLLIGNAPQRQRVPEPVSLRILPSMMDALSSPAAFDPEAFTTDFPVSTTEDAGALAVSGREWKHVRDGDTEKLYRPSEDPQERVNLASEHPEVLAGLGDLVDRHRFHQRERELIADSLRNTEVRL